MHVPTHLHTSSHVLLYTYICAVLLPLKNDLSSDLVGLNVIPKLFLAFVDHMLKEVLVLRLSSGHSHRSLNEFLVTAILLQQNRTTAPVNLNHHV